MHWAHTAAYRLPPQLIKELPRAVRGTTSALQPIARDARDGVLAPPYAPTVALVGNEDEVTGVLTAMVGIRSSSL